MVTTTVILQTIFSGVKNITWHFCNPLLLNLLLDPVSVVPREPHIPLSLLFGLPHTSVCLQFPQPAPVILLQRTTFRRLGLLLPEKLGELEVPRNYFPPGRLLASDWMVRESQSRDKRTLYPEV